MAKYIVTIDMDSAAFEDNEPSEVSRILRELANEIEETGDGSRRTLRDINGNYVGTAVTVEQS